MRWVWCVHREANGPPPGLSPWPAGSLPSSRQSLHTIFPCVLIMFALLLFTHDGWTDPLGNGVNADAIVYRVAVNEWPTVEDAEVVARELRECGIGTNPGEEWRVVPIEDIDNYTLVA